MNSLAAGDCGSHRPLRLPSGLSLQCCPHVLERRCFSDTILAAEVSDGDPSRSTYTTCSTGFFFSLTHMFLFNIPRPSPSCALIGKSGCPTLLKPVQFEPP